MAQYYLADETEKSLHVAQLIVAGKIQNYRNVLRRYIRDYGEDNEVENISKALDYSKRDALRSRDKKELMIHYFIYFTNKFY